MRVSGILEFNAVLSIKCKSAASRSAIHFSASCSSVRSAETINADGEKDEGEYDDDDACEVSSQVSGADDGGAEDEGKEEEEDVFFHAGRYAMRALCSDATARWAGGRNS